jgi:syntaxin 5
MVAEQRETVQRIDADTHDIMSNVSGAQRELLKYYASISSNRWLMLKIFGVLIVFVSGFYFTACTYAYLTPPVPCLHSRIMIPQFSTS